MFTVSAIGLQKREELSGKEMYKTKTHYESFAGMFQVRIKQVLHHVQQDVFKGKH